jgi:membrane-associated phospholipid phosphatase
MEHFNKAFKIMIKPWFILGFLVLLVVCYLWLDKIIAEYFFQLHLVQKLHFLNYLTDLGKGLAYGLILGTLVFFFRFIRPNAKFEGRAWFLLLCILIPNAFCLLLKISFGRARPEVLLDSQQYGFYWLKFNKLYWSFPSSHTSTIMGLLIGLGLLFPRSLIYLLIPGLLVIASRIFLYQHYFSDVLTAAYLAFIEIGILVYCIREQKWFLQAK